MSDGEFINYYQLKIADFYNIPINNVEKLVPNCFDKEQFVFHFENLQRYLTLGLKLKRIHRVLECDQSQWLKSYVKKIKAEIVLRKMEKRCTN